MIKPFLILLLMVLFLSNVESKETNSSFLKGNFKALYVKEFKSLHKKLSQSNGQIEYNFPGQIKLTQKTPFESIIVSNGNTLWYYTAPFDPEVEKGEVSIQKVKNHPLSKLFDVLKAGLKTNKDYSVKKISKGYSLAFNSQLKNEIEIDTVDLEFSSSKNLKFNNVKSIVIHFVGGKKETYKLENVESPVKFSKNYFDFKVPKGAKVNNL